MLPFASRWSRRLAPLVIVCLLIGGLARQVVAMPARQPAAPAADSPFGVNAHIASRFPVYGKRSVPANAVGDLGAGWAREDFAWPFIEPRPDVWQWGDIDEMVAEHEARGVQILARVGYSVGWATATRSDPDDGQSFALPQMSAWRDYVRALAERYQGRVRHWEIWNEPDNPTFWQGTPNPRAYARLLRAANEEIKSVDPNAVVVVGGLNPFDTTYLEGIAQAGAWDAFDVLGIHPYTDPLSPEQGRIGPHGIGGVRAVLNRYGDKPIWITEVGWESGMSERNPRGAVDEQDQANYLVRAYMQLLAEPGVEKVFWYTLHDDVHSPFGLVRFGAGYHDYGSRKPAFEAYATMARELAGARFVGTVDLGEQRRVIEDWETNRRWVRAGPENGRLQPSATHWYGGERSGRFAYRFATTGNDWAAYRPFETMEIGRPRAIGLWVTSNNSGHLLQVQLADEAGEVLQFPLGKVSGDGWVWMQTSITGFAEPGNRLGGGNNNGRLDGDVRVHALVLDDQPNTTRVTGALWIDNLTAIYEPEVYAYRWQRDEEIIDVVWSPEGASVKLPSASSSATIIDRDNAQTTLLARNGVITLRAGERPRYVHHQAGD